MRISLSLLGSVMTNPSFELVFHVVLKLFLKKEYANNQSYFLSYVCICGLHEYTFAIIVV